MRNPPHRNELLNLAHQLVQNHLLQGALAIDATIGNGHDTICLAQWVGSSGLVYGFDIQASALATTRQRLQDAQLLSVVQLIQANHAELMQHIDPEHHAKINVCMFNLGYLPGSDKSIQTQSSSTLTALNAALTLLAPQGLITILAYPGHAGGDLETANVADWCAELNSAEVTVREYLSQNPKASAPKLFTIEKNSAR